MDTTTTTDNSATDDDQIATLAQKRETAWISLGGGAQKSKSAFDMDGVLRPYFNETWDLAEALIASPMLESQAFTDSLSPETIAPFLGMGVDALMKLTIAWANEESGIRTYFENQAIARAKALHESGTRDELLESIAELIAAIEARQLLGTR